MKNQPSTSFKDAVEKYCAQRGLVVSEAKVIKLTCMNPPIEKLDIGIISTLLNCEELRLSTNALPGLMPLTNMRNLRILTLSRNSIKSIRPLDDVAQTLEELWLSYNLLEKLNNLGKLEKLKVLYLAHNKISDINELDKIRDLENLKVTVMQGNPFYPSDLSAGRLSVLKKLPQLTMIDGKMVTNTEREGLSLGQEADDEEEE